MPDIAVEREDKSQWFCLQTSHPEKQQQQNHPNATMLVDYSPQTCSSLPRNGFLYGIYRYLIKNDNDYASLGMCLEQNRRL